MGVFHVFYKLYKWYEIAQHTTNAWKYPFHYFPISSIVLLVLCLFLKTPILYRFACFMFVFKDTNSQNQNKWIEVASNFFIRA